MCQLSYKTVLRVTMKSVLALGLWLVCVAGVDSTIATQTWPQTQVTDGKSQLLKMFNFQQSFISMQNALLNLQQFVDSVDYDGLIKDIQLFRSDLDKTKTKLNNTEIELEKSKTKGLDMDIQVKNTKARLDNVEKQLEETKTKLDNTKTELDKTKAKLDNADIKLQETKTKLIMAENALGETKHELQAISSIEPGSSFIRWGRMNCTGNSDLVNSGAVGGSYYGHTGAAVNALCLTLKPELEDLDPKPKYYTLLYGAEYEHFHGHQNDKVPCAVCHTPLTSTIMVPATRSCPPGWTVQYSGYLSAGHNNHKAATEFLCVDGQPDGFSAGKGANDNGYLFYHTYTRCGSLHCPPFSNDLAVTCAVCSK